MGNEFSQRRRERYLDEAAYAAFRRGSLLDLEDTELLLKEQLPQLSHDDSAYKQWTSEVMLRRVELLIGSYSAGDSLESIALSFPAVLAAAEACALSNPPYQSEPLYLGQMDTYCYAMWLLSLCKLLRHDALLLRVIALFDVAQHENRGKDALFEALVARLGGDAAPVNPLHSMFEMLAAHPLLLQGINATADQRSGCVAAFLKQWYPAMKGCYWHNRHVRLPQNFFGYWALEAGLVTVLWNIDDRDYRDLPFYPKDLVEFARAGNV